MGNFLLAWPLIIQNEKLEVTDDPKDSGGYSVAGIASKFYPKERAITLAKELGLKHGEWDDRLLEPVQDFYRRKQWDVVRGDEIINQEAVNTILDRGVNLGLGTSIKMAQSACGLPETGEMNDETVAKINELNNYA